jgi:diacylglycerol kinase family enzyme
MVTNLLKLSINHLIHFKLSLFLIKDSKVIISILVELKVFVKLPKIIILIAGGDGTVCSVINYMKTIP